MPFHALDVPQVQPSVRREGFATTPDVTWDDVGSLSDIRCGIPPSPIQGLGVRGPACPQQYVNCQNDLLLLPNKSTPLGRSAIQCLRLCNFARK